jgi:hypothetical protein
LNSAIEEKMNPIQAIYRHGAVPHEEGNGALFFPVANLRFGVVAHPDGLEVDTSGFSSKGLVDYAKIIWNDIHGTINRTSNNKILSDFVMVPSGLNILVSRHFVLLVGLQLGLLVSHMKQLNRYSVLDDVGLHLFACRCWDMNPKILSHSFSDHADEGHQTWGL